METSNVTTTQKQKQKQKKRGLEVHQGTPCVVMTHRPKWRTLFYSHGGSTYYKTLKQKKRLIQGKLYKQMPSNYVATTHLGNNNRGVWVSRGFLGTGEGCSDSVGVELSVVGGHSCLVRSETCRCAATTHLGVVEWCGCRWCHGNALQR